MRVPSLSPLLIPVLLALGCGPGELSIQDGSGPGDGEPPTEDDGTPGDTDASDVLPTGCDAIPTWATPTPDATHVDPEVRPELTLRAPLPDAASLLLRIEGVPGTITLDDARTRAVFTPDAPLEHGTAYTLTAEACGESLSHVFTTRPAPVPVEAILGHTWQVPLDELDWLAPVSAGLFLPLVDVDMLLLQATPSEHPTHPVAFVATLGVDDDGPRAASCLPLFDLGDADLSANPVFSTPPVDLTLPWDEDGVISPDGQLGGVVSSDGQTLEDLEFTGMLDVRPLEALVPGPDVCGVSATLGEPCMPCPDGEVACLPVFATLPAAEIVPDLDLEASAAEANEDCDLPSLPFLP